MSRRPARGYYRVQWSGKFWDVWPTDRHPRGVELMGGWFTLARAGDAARALAAADHAEGESESPAHKYEGFLRWLEEMRAVNHADDHRLPGRGHMTNIIDRAAEVIRQVDGDHTLGAGALAEALADAGLLTPYLPEPTRIQPDGSPEWTSASHATIGVDGNLVYSDGALLTPGEAREEAAMILAAAAHAERNQK